MAKKVILEIKNKIIIFFTKIKKIPIKKFIQYNFRGPVSLIVTTGVLYFLYSIYKSPFITNISKDLNKSLLIFIISFLFFGIIILKVIVDFLGIFLFDKGKGSMIKK